MPSRTFLVEVTDDGTVIVGALDRVRRTVRQTRQSFDPAEPVETWIELTGLIVATNTRSSADATVLFSAGAIRAAAEA